MGWHFGMEAQSNANVENPDSCLDHGHPGDNLGRLSLAYAVGCWIQSSLLSDVKSKISHGLVSLDLESFHLAYDFSAAGAKANACTPHDRHLSCTHLHRDCTRDALLQVYV